MRTPVRSGPPVAVEGLHISGVGAVGAFVCWEAHRQQIPFTWDDAESPHNAWEVSTGGILPYQDETPSWYAAGYRFWRDQAVQREEFARHLEPAQLIYALKGRPVRMARDAEPLATGASGLRLWQETCPAWQLNVQEFVTATRATFARLRQLVTSAEPEPDVVHLRCHGIHDPASRPVALWGWMVPVHLRPTVACAFWPAEGEPRLKLHFGDPAHPMARYYLQPLSGHRDYWSAGSDSRRQATPTVDAVLAQDCLKRFQDAAAQVWGPWLEIHYYTDSMGQGWRPESRTKEWKAGPIGRWVTPAVLVPRPQAGNGIQCGPLLAHLLVKTALSPRRPVA